MSNGQQLEMVEGNLVEVHPANFDVGDALVGACVQVCVRNFAHYMYTRVRNNIYTHT